MKKYACIFNIGLTNAMEYRMDFFLSLISTAFPVIVQLYLWNAIYSGPSGVDNGYTYQQMILYTLMAGLTAKMVSTGFEYEINTDIKDGGLNKYIVKPVNYFLYRLFAFYGGKIPSAGILSVIMIISLTVASVVLRTSLELPRILLYILSLSLAILLNFGIFYSIAMLGFWITEISKLFGTISIVLIVISGGVFPLDIFGGNIQKITTLLPFKYTTQFPVDILNGRLAWQEILNGFQYQIFWVAVFMITACLLWKNGLKHYVAVGG